MVTEKQTAGKGRKKKERKAGPRTDITGGKTCRIKDLVVVKDPRDSGQMFTALVTGAYTLAGAWHVQLGPPPSKAPEQRIPRVSTPARNIKDTYRRQR